MMHPDLPAGHNYSGLRFGQSEYCIVVLLVQTLISRLAGM